MNAVSPMFLLFAQLLYPGAIFGFRQEVLGWLTDHKWKGIDKAKVHIISIRIFTLHELY